MNLDIQLALSGLGSAGALALLAVGLVVTFRGSGVLNFAHGAIATATVYTYLSLYHEGWPIGLAMVAGLVVAVAIATAFYGLVMRRLTHASVLAKVVASLGLMIAIQGTVSSWAGDDPPIAPSLLKPSTITLPFGSPKFTLGSDRLWIFVIALSATALLWVVFRWTRFGLTTQAIADNQQAVTLVGSSPEKIALANWCVGALLAGGAGILLTTLVPIDPTFFTLALVTAIAAALVGGLTSFWLTFVGALLIGLLQPIIAHYAVNLQRYTHVGGWADAFPFIVIAFVVIVRGRAIPLRDTVRLAYLPPARLPRHPLIATAVAFVVGVGWYFLLPSSWADPMSVTLIGALLCLSAVVITGYVGQISLVQQGFAGFAAFSTAIFATDHGIPFPWSILLGALVAVPLGVVVGLPALRVRGIQLAVVTLGAALALQDMAFNSKGFSGGDLGRAVSPAKIGPIDLNGISQPRNFGILCLVVFCLAVLGVVALRRSALGQRFLAVRNNERGSGASGISLTRVKLSAFAISSFLAGISGGLMAYHSLQVNGQNYDIFGSVLITGIAYVGGITSLVGAFIGGLFFDGGVLTHLGAVIWNSDWNQAIAGFALLNVVANHPDGIAGIPDQIKTSLQRRRGARLMADELARAAHDPPEAAQREPEPASVAVGTPQDGVEP